MKQYIKKYVITDIFKSLINIIFEQLLIFVKNVQLFYFIIRKISLFI